MIRKARHNERCSSCKKNVQQLLGTLFGLVIPNHDLQLPCKLCDFKNAVFYESLEEIYEALQCHRGHMQFVRSAKLPIVDYFIPERQMIVGFDESCHSISIKKEKTDPFFI